MRPQLGKIGAWGHESLLPPDLVRELEQLGYSAVWLGGSPGGDLGMVDPLLAATDTLVVATGITNIWRDPARAPRRRQPLSRPDELRVEYAPTRLERR